MVEAIEWLRLLITNHGSLEYVIIFLGAAFGGEVAMVALGFLAAQGVLSLYTLFVVSFFGTLSSDILYFSIGRTKTAGKFFSHRYTNGTINMITEAVRKVSKGSHFVALLLANFMIASRIILIIYVSKTNIKFGRFVYYESISLVLWLLALISIGFLSGIGFTYYSGILENIYAGIGYVLLMFILVVIVQLWIKRIFTKEGEEIIKENLEE